MCYQTTTHGLHCFRTPAMTIVIPTFLESYIRLFLALYAFLLSRRRSRYNFNLKLCYSDI